MIRTFHFLKTVLPVFLLNDLLMKNRACIWVWPWNMQLLVLFDQRWTCKLGATHMYFHLMFLFLIWLLWILGWGWLNVLFKKMLYIVYLNWSFYNHMMIRHQSFLPLLLLEYIKQLLLLPKLDILIDYQETWVDMQSTCWL